ncbi:Iron-sulfur cluster assembly protein SufD [Indibacter alkaliphilus LW1]|uniref:Iron-sulfur cluster assembly protein SufD n=1 Tax=Indibacter alkaliphilus (strain CCUG 57479 / KCTC 22604 / LW1) TaxID=1189612 RepID=S2DRX7_INDAL|nr:Fe-S cluster assembly protein SufD [Indibacter alkaliphilus]EOZ92603.1 Iron-sulfur cluster assembly protein SufD [Indibacter alkaliphilus LW1]
MATAIKTDILNAFLDKIDESNFSSLKEKAQQRLRETGLPGIKDEEYKFTSILRKIEKSIENFSCAAASELSEEDVQESLPQGFSGDYLVINNGKPELNLSKISSQHYKVTLLSEAENQTLGSIAKIEKDPFTALNSASFADGLSISVDKNSKIEQPIFILLFNKANQGEVINSRLLIEIGENAEVSFLENTISLDERAYFANQVVEVKASPNSQTKYAKLQNESRNAITVNNFETDIHRDAVFTSTVISLNGDMVRNNLSLNLLDSGCEGNMYGLYLLNGKTHVDNHTNVDHTKPHAESNELYKGILTDSSRGVFNGKIFVRQDAQKTNAFQQNNNILLSEDATINTKPQLEIWADDVKCSHGCTTGQLDEEALFYLQARGLGRDQARGFLLYAFAGEIMEYISDDSFRQQVIDLVQERLGSQI